MEEIFPKKLVIDEQLVEIFETSDVESVENESEQQADSNTAKVGDEVYQDAEEDEPNSEKNRDRFLNEIVNGILNVDFLGNIAARSLYDFGYHSSRVLETKKQKIARIAREIEDLRIDDERENTSAAEVETVENLSKLLDSLDSSRNDLSEQEKYNQYFLKQKRVFDEITLHVAGLSLETTPPTEEPKIVDMSRILQLENRMHSVEERLGIDKSIPQPASNLLTRLRDLQRRIGVIQNPEYTLDVVERKLTSLRKLHEDFLSSKSLATVGLQMQGQPQSSGNMTEMVEDLHKALPDITALNTVLPLLIQRLKSLYVVHADLGHSIEAVKSIDDLMAGLKTDMLGWSKHLDVLNSKVDEMNEDSKKNRDSLAVKVEELDAKLTKFP